MDTTTTAVAAPVNLSKGQNVNLTKDNPGVTTYKCGLSWDAQPSGGTDCDLDAFALVCDTSGTVKDYLYFNSNVKDISAKDSSRWNDSSRPYPFILDGALTHSGDERTGEAAGDDETITIDLTKLPTWVGKIILCANIYEATSRKQNFGQVKNAAINLYDSAGNTVAGFKVDLSEDFSTYDCLAYAELYSKDGEWKYRALATGSNGTIADAVTRTY
jgi:tellurium resistance protein TerD